mmetsp:Transcript_5218/g.16727  ORF Transcript_5218/g.16727 Transcript_5218/m.16727 type:complete len:328 (+) Transcript_5218:134-1117(+)
MHCGMARAQPTTGPAGLHGGGEPQLTQRREGRPLGDDELAVRVRDVALDVAAVDEVGEDALDLVDLHLGVRRLEASLEALDVELGRLVRVEQRDAAEEVAVHDQLGALDEQVRAVPDEALLVRRELLLERVEVACAAAERGWRGGCGCGCGAGLGVCLGAGLGCVTWMCLGRVWSVSRRCLGCVWGGHLWRAYRSVVEWCVGSVWERAASVHGAAERDEVVESVLAQQRLGREHAEREPDGHEVAEHKPLVASRGARAALEGPGELPLRGAKVGVKQRQPAREVPDRAGQARKGKGRKRALAGPAGSKEVGRGKRRRDCCCVDSSRP